MASPYKASKIWIKRFSEYLAYEISHRLDSWRGFLYICLLSFPRFWTFFIDWFAFFIIEGVTVNRLYHAKFKVLLTSKRFYSVRTTHYRIDFSDRLKSG